MARGDLKGTLTGSGASIGATNALTGSVVVDVGDLVFAPFCQQTNLTATGASDNLGAGNVYAATNAGSDTGAATGRAFWAYIATPGTLTTLTIAATASANDYSGVAAVYEGPFLSSPLDANPANITNDATSPFRSASTGTLAQSDELIVGWTCVQQAETYSAEAPGAIDAQQVPAGSSFRSVVGHYVVSATDPVLFGFTASANPAQAGTIGISSFKFAPPSGLGPLIGGARNVLVGGGAVLN